MTTILHQDPDRRCKPLEEWPEADQTWWLAALVPGDLLQEGGSRAGYSEHTNRGLERNYGRWLTWLDRRGQLDRTGSPSDRITPAQVRAYVADLERYNATHTILTKLGDLLAAARVMEPPRDWAWINQIARPIRARHQPARPKRPRLVATSTLFNLGLDLMAAAERVTSTRDRAVGFRDGLMLSSLAARPLRLANLVGLTLERTLVRRGKHWWIEIPAANTKTKQPIELPWPEPLIAALEIYLSCHRPVLAECYEPGRPAAGQALWLSRGGGAMSRNRIYDRITKLTLKNLGRSVNPHLFRDCAATSLAIEDPRHVRIASTLLGHRRFATTERFYIQANNIEASRIMQNFLLSLRRGAGARLANTGRGLSRPINGCDGRGRVTPCRAGAVKQRHSNNKL
jgi:integrase/recombinase XerD